MLPTDGLALSSKQKMTAETLEQLAAVIFFVSKPPAIYQPALDAVLQTDRGRQRLKSAQKIDIATFLRQHLSVPAAQFPNI